MMTRSFMLLLAGLVLLTGCNTPSYINIPDDGGDYAINDPNQLTVIKVEQKALTYLLSKTGLKGDVAIRFPEGTSDRAAIMAVSGIVGYNVFPEGQTPSGEYQIVEIREISARGGRARVDVICPGKLRERELVEIHMRWDVIRGWIGERLHTRNIQLDRLDSQLLAPPAAPAKQPVFNPEAPANDTTPAEQPAANPQPEPYK